MRKPVAATALAIATLLGIGSANAAPPQRSSEGPWAKGHVLVQPKPGLSSEAFNRILRAHGAKATPLGSSSVYLVEAPANASEKALAAVLANNPHFEFVDLDHEVAPNFVPNDPYFGSSWHLSKINASGAWATTQGRGVTIAILDTGVDGSHPELAPKVIPGWNFYDNNSNTADVYGHGTAVAGTAAAATNNSAGVAAVAGDARIMPVRISAPDGFAYTSTVVKAITWAADQGARVINISFDGMAGNSSVVSAAEYAKGKGGLVVVAAGNNSSQLSIPWTTSLIPVSATNSSDVKASWSNWGNFIALAAPGDMIWTTRQGGSYWQCYGTSFAAPVTSGVIALMMAANPGLSSSTVQSLLYSSAVDLGSAGKDVNFGYGRVDAAAAVQAALSGGTSTKTIADAEAPKVAITSPAGSSTVSGLTTVDVSASDNVGVTKVELRVNGSLHATDTTAPFGFSWDTSRVSNGMANLEARAYDAAGNVVSSQIVAVNVANAVVADTTPPSVAIANPANGSRVSGTVSVTVSGNDNSGVAGLRLELYVGGQRVASSTGTSSLKFNWNTRKLSAGTYTLQSRAVDAAGNVSTSSVTVTR